MKKYILIIETPDCFTPNTDTVEIHIKGAPENSFIKAEIMPYPLFKDNGDELNESLKTPELPTLKTPELPTQIIPNYKNLGFKQGAKHDR